MKYRLMGFTVFVAALFFAPLMAHHGDAGRFEDEVTTVTGVVVAFQLIYPHAIIIFEVENENDNVVRWQAELGSPTRLATFGWNRNTLPPGTEVQITGRVIKSGAPYFSLTERARVVLVESCEEIYRSRSLPEDELSCN